MTTRTWVAGLHSGYNAQSPTAWSPAGAPQPGDNLKMVNGVMGISNYNLAGDELHLGNGQTNVGEVWISLNGGADIKATAVGGLLSYGDPLRVNVNVGTNHLAADNLEAIQGTVNLQANTNLVVTGKLAFAYFGDIVGPGTVTNNGDISIADGTISANVNGHGTLELHNYHDGLGSQVISGAIGANQKVLLVDHDHATTTELVHPQSFKASLGMDLRDPAEVGNVTLKVDGIHASQMDIRGDMLSLEGPGGRVLWQVREHLPAGVSTSMANTATGTNIVFTPHQLVG